MSSVKSSWNSSKGAKPGAPGLVETSQREPYQRTEKSGEKSATGLRCG
jgi:hypothetical protein